jgi:hypothetical protein|tara:strand:- start:874 stop:1191 length:318 start_codon:yes stop_codon:yes gene_type:complete
MNLLENITCWYYGSREKFPVLKQSTSMEDLKEKDIENTKKLYENKEICCGCCYNNMNMSNSENIQHAKIGEKNFYFCTHECYLEWLNTPGNMWFGFNYTSSSEKG